MDNCSACKHWSEGEYWRQREHDENDRVGICTPPNPKVAMAICDGEGIDGELITTDKFCCILFEKK